MRAVHMENFNSWLFQQTRCPWFFAAAIVYKYMHIYLWSILAAAFGGSENKNCR